MQPVTYDISQFGWNPLTNSFHGIAPHLEAILPDGSIHPEAFPNQKQKFVIKNFKTGNFREFVYRMELPGYWIFESEDGIICEICIDPDFDYPSVVYEQYLR